ncbi:dITP/XTP pyrophosphatase [Bienertia sinuspersici]
MEECMNTKQGGWNRLQEHSTMELSKHGSILYLRDQEWWSYEPPLDASWYWKRICAIKEQVKRVCNQNDIRGMRRYKYRFCTWVAVQGRLPSTERMVKMGSQIEETCPLCSNDEESIQHLFFECSYSQEVLNELI